MQLLMLSWFSKFGRNFNKTLFTSRQLTSLAIENKTIPKHRRKNQENLEKEAKMRKECPDKDQYIKKNQRRDMLSRKTDSDYLYLIHQI